MEKSERPIKELRNATEFRGKAGVEGQAYSKGFIPATQVATVD